MTWLRFLLPNEASQIDQGISQGLKCVKMGADALESNQHSAELVFPSEEAFNRSESLLKDVLVEMLFAAAPFLIALTKVNIRAHFAVENQLPIGLRIVDAIEANNCPFKGLAHFNKGLLQLFESRFEQEAFIPISRSFDEGSDHVYIPIAKRHDLIAFDLFVAVEANIIAAFLRRMVGPVAVNDARIEQSIPAKEHHRVGKNIVEATVFHPSLKGSKNVARIGSKITWFVFSNLK